MNKRNINHIICFGVVILLLSSCKKMLDINWNPSVPQEVDAELYLPPIIYHMANGYAQDQRIINKFTQAALGASTDRASYIWEKHGYPGGVSDVGGVQWRTVYFNHGVNLERLLQKAKEKEKNEFAGIGYAIKAWDFQILTDYHGPIPINDLYHPTRLIYDYEDQPEVYKRVIALCDTALMYLAKPSDFDYTALLQKYDYLYNGNMARWKKFVYGIKAMNYSRYMNKPDFKTNYADSVLKYIDLSFEVNGDDACVKFTASNTDNSAVYGPALAYLSSVYYNRPGKPIVSYLTGGVRGEPMEEPRAMDSLPDPRVSRMLKPYGVDSLYLGAIPNGLAVANTNLSTIGSFYLFKDKADFPLLTFSQLQFMKAEVLFLLGRKEEALASYTTAIRNHMTFVNKYNAITQEGLTVLPPQITNAEINKYMLSSEVAQTAEALTLADIMGQKYIALWGWGGYDIWVDMRKYRYDPTIFRQYIQLTGVQLELNSYCYRVRPRFNSEYAWNVEALQKFGGLEANYVSQPTWFVLNNY